MSITIEPAPIHAYMYCNSCGFHHGPTYTQCASASTPTSTPSNDITADDIESAITELSPRSPQGTDRSTLNSMINSLTSSTAASVLSVIEDDTAPTALAVDYDFEGDFFPHFATTCLTKEMIYVIDIRSTNASAAEFILYRLKLYLAGRHHHHIMIN